LATRNRHLLLLELLPLFAILAALGQDKIQDVLGSSNNQFRVVNTYPEYWVGGKPFLMYSGSCLYTRIPRDRWAQELIHQKEMGINTVEILPMWAWHEPSEGNFDFDGHTNPRRDMDYLVRLVDLLGLKLSVRPGPYLTGEWRNGGYPAWLLIRPEYRMSEQSILENRYPRWSALQYEKSEQAAAEWLKNDTHLRYTRQWYHEVLGRLKPELASNGGPIINIQIDDDQASGRANYNGPNFWKYMDLLRQYAKEATDNSPIPYYLDGEDMRVNAEANDATTEPFWNTGQEYLFSPQHMNADGYSTAEEAAKNKFFTEILKTQPLTVAGHIEFQTSWFPTWKDTYTITEDPTNQLMASSVMFQNGLKMLNYYPPGDTLYPAGFETPSTNHFYAWDVAVNYAGKETARAATTRRYGRLLNGMAPVLGSAHFLPDAGVVYPMATYPQAPMTPVEAKHIAAIAQRLLWSGASGHFNFELIDSDHSPIEDFLRYRVLILFNPLSGEDDLKTYPHLAQFSTKAQKLVQDYIEAGGTLVIFPSMPKGEIFDKLLAPLGKAEKSSGIDKVVFDDGKQWASLDFHTVLHLPANVHGEEMGRGLMKARVDQSQMEGSVRVYARDSHGEVVGAKYAHGRGQIIFFGVDPTLWSAHAGSDAAPNEADMSSVTDYSEQLQASARETLPEMMKEAGISRKVYETEVLQSPRDIGLYLTELVADPGSRSFETREHGAPAYGFVGVTNFSLEQSRTADVLVTDPALSDLNAGGAKRYLHLPRFTLPPRQALLLPVHIPLSSEFWHFSPGLSASAEVAFATAELSKVDYNGAELRLEFTAPTDGEVALKLERRPDGAMVDGKPAAIQEDSSGHLYHIQIPKGDTPHFVRIVQVAYQQAHPRMTVVASGSWIAGATAEAHLSLENPGPNPIEGELRLDPGKISRAAIPAISVSVPARSSRVFNFPVTICADAPENQLAELRAEFHEEDAQASWTADGQARIHRPFEWKISPVQNFPLRQDESFPMVHPTLISLALPGTAVIRVHIKNHLDRVQDIFIRTEGDQLDFSESATFLHLAPQQEAEAEIHIRPVKGSNAYPFHIELQSKEYSAKEDALLAAVKDGEAIAYSFDYDRDGFADVILENSHLRLFVSPNGGGRAFGFVLKDSDRNAFDSVGGLRDTFTTRVEPEDRKGADWERAGWGGLYNRPYTFQLTAASGTEAEVHFDYNAPDIYPKGVQLQRALKLAGSRNLVIEETSITPLGIGNPQAYVLENSLPFNVFKQPNDSDWFVQGQPVRDFTPSQEVTLPNSAAYVGAKTKEGGQILALIPLTAPSQIQMVVENHSALLRFIYSDFTAANLPQIYRTAYYLSDRSTLKDVEEIAAELKAKN
jgi:hypothetical protein